MKNKFLRLNNNLKFAKRKKSPKAQVSMEYMIIIGFVTVITIPLIIIFNTHSIQINEGIISNQVDIIAAKIVDASESVYYLGNTSKVTFKVQLPESIDSATIGNSEVVFLIKKRNGIDHIVHYSSVPINGTASISKGIHNIIVESRGDYVWVNISN